MGSVSITWYGQSGFRLAAGGSRILIDPFLAERDDRRYPPPASAADFTDITLVLSTHEHAGDGLVTQSSRRCWPRWLPTC